MTRTDLSFTAIPFTLLFALLLTACEPISRQAMPPAAAALATATAAQEPIVADTPTAQPLPAPVDVAISNTVDAAKTERGKQVYLNSYCGVCHALASARTKGIFGPAHEHIATTAALRIASPDYTGSATSAAGYLRESIETPQTYAAPGVANLSHPMPPYTGLSETDLDALIYFLLQQE